MTWTWIDIHVREELVSFLRKKEESYISSSSHFPGPTGQGGANAKEDVRKKKGKDASCEEDEAVFEGKAKQVKQHESYGLVSIRLSDRTTHSCPNSFSLCLLRKGHKGEKNVSHGKLRFHLRRKKYPSENQ